MNKIIEPKICHCSEGLFSFDPSEGHYHCLGCDCILGSEEGNICCWCEELKEEEENQLRLTLHLHTLLHD